SSSQLDCYDLNSLVGGSHPELGKSGGMLDHYDRNFEFDSINFENLTSTYGKDSTHQPLYISNEPSMTIMDSLQDFDFLTNIEPTKTIKSETKLGLQNADLGCFNSVKDSSANQPMLYNSQSSDSFSGQNDSSSKQNSNLVLVEDQERLEKSRQSARDCRARKRLKYQYLDTMIRKEENEILQMNVKLEEIRNWADSVDNKEMTSLAMINFLSEGTQSNHYDYYRNPDDIFDSNSR
ncbi:MAG: cAMP-responsive element-binding protein-like 2, partial [Paramarteilia canceri]